MPNRTLTEFSQGRNSRIVDVSEYNYKLHLIDFTSSMRPNRAMPERRRTSFEELVDNDREGFRTRIVDNLVEKINNHNLNTKIKDFNSFKDAFRLAFQSESGGRNFYGELSGQEDLLMRLFREPKIQQMVTENGKENRSRGLARKFGIDIARARQLYDQIRRVEIERISEGWIPESQLKQPHLIRSPTEPRGMLIAQRAQSGTLYRRASPRAFTAPQQRFLLNNINIPKAKLTAEFNILFNEQRTRNSVYFKQYRLLKESGRARVGRLWAEPEPDNDMFFT